MNILIRAAIPVMLIMSGPCGFSQAAPVAENPCAMHASHAGAGAHHAAVERHGDEAMGFPHDKTTHHFRLEKDGGTIEVTANDPKDAADIEAIRTHRRISPRFSARATSPFPCLCTTASPPA